MPMSPAWTGALLAGFGLGAFVPATNAVIMRTAPPGPLADAGLRPPHETGPSGAFG